MEATAQLQVSTRMNHTVVRYVGLALFHMLHYFILNEYREHCQSTSKYGSEDRQIQHAQETNILEPRRCELYNVVP